jgi:hypothetical protein
MSAEPLGAAPAAASGPVLRRSGAGTPATHLDPALPPAEVFAGLPPEVQRLVAAVGALYHGRWDDCAEDVRRRRAGRPYLYRLNLGVDDDLGWLHRLATYEIARGETFAFNALPLETTR